MIKLLLAQRDTVPETREHRNAVYLPAAVVPVYLLALACFQTAKLAGVGTEQQELSIVVGIQTTDLLIGKPKRLSGLDTHLYNIYLMESHCLWS